MVRALTQPGPKADIDPFLPNLLPKPVLARLAVGGEIGANYPL